MLPLMSNEAVDARHKTDSELYHALMLKEEEKKVIELCRRVPDHALHILTVHNDTLLHLATFLEKASLVLKLLEELPDHCLDKMTRQNKAGATILHETATNNHTLGVADLVLRKAPGLLGMRNNNGETALFHAARYGKQEIFDLLAGKISGYDQPSKLSFFQRDDKTTALHISILSEHYDLALHIADDYKFLIDMKDEDGMSALQLLSCNTEAFKFSKVKWSCSLTRRKVIPMEKQRYESAMKLAKFLVKTDTSWENSYTIQDRKPRIHKYRGPVSANVPSAEIGPGEWDVETPLFLATKSGCVEIVKEILKVYPQAVEHINDKGQNILHVAIKYHQLEIFNLIIQMKAPMRRLVRKIDNDGNTILHMVGIKRSDYVPEKMEGPALVLQEELLWYERVSEVTLPQFVYHRNKMGMTAEALFDTTNKELRVLSKEWIKHTAEGCTIVEVLIATVAFAAAYTIPGGSNEQTGFPVLINHPFFVLFTMSDVLSLTFSLASVVTFLSILTSPFRLQDFKRSLPNKLMIGFAFLFLSVCMMMIAFSATILLMIKNKENWAKILLYTFSFIPVGGFALTYFPIYMKTAIERACKYLSKNISQWIPQSFLALLMKISCICDCFRSRSPNSSIP